MLTQERLKELLHYDTDTGIFTWKIKRNINALVGDVAGSTNKKGYIYIRIDSKNYLTHRLVFLYMTGAFPKEYVDHINHVKNDNRWNNLREATNSENQLNRNRKFNSKSGYKGVHWCNRMRKWIAKCVINGKTHYLGNFNDPQLAGQTYDAFAKTKHGEFYLPQAIAEQK